MKKFALSVIFIFLAVAHISAADWKGKKSEWNGCTRYEFNLEGRDATVVIPENALPGNPWIWRPAFFGAFPNLDEALLRKGYHITYFNTTDEFGSEGGLKAGKIFYDHCVAHGLSSKTILEGLSRGGYYSLCWSEKYPDCVAALLLDNPLVDPTLLDFYEQKQKEHPEYNLPDMDIHHNASRNISILAKHRIPVMLLSGGTDEVVPYPSQGKIIHDVYARYDVPFHYIVRPHSGHHPHGYDVPTPIVDYLTSAFYGTLPTGAKKVACIGDSMTEGVGTQDYVTQSYPARLQAMLGEGYLVRNFGVSCATMIKEGTDSGRPFGYARLPTMKQAMDYNPDIVIIALGVNDCKSYNWEAHGKDFEADYQEMITTLKRLPSIPEIYLVIEPYVNINKQTRSWGFENKGYYEETTEKIRKLAEDNGLTVIDLSKVFLGEDVECIAENDHPNLLGTTLMARKTAHVILEK